jgi:hypothetical protein
MRRLGDLANSVQHVRDTVASFGGTLEHAWATAGVTTSSPC